MMDIDKQSPIPLYAQVQQAIHEEIKAGTWPEGSQIPPEQELMERYRIGRATVRAAIEELQRQGVVEKRHGFGTFVSKKRNPSMAFAPMISLSFNVRQLGFSQENEILEEQDIQVDRDKAKLFSIKEGQTLHLVKRLRKADGEAIALEEDYFAPALKEALKGEDLSQSLVNILVKKHGVSIKRFDQSVTLRQATKEEAEKLHLSGDAEVVDMIRTLLEKGESEPCFFVHFVANADMLALTGAME